MPRSVAIKVSITDATFYKTTELKTLKNQEEPRYPTFFEQQTGKFLRKYLRYLSLPLAVSLKNFLKWKSTVEVGYLDNTL